MHIVIGGQDEVAFRLAEALMVEHEVVLILPDGHRSTFTDTLDCHAVHGTLTATGTLRKAAVPSADVFIACSLLDERNLVSCVAAKRMGAKRTICFLFRRDFDSSADEDGAVAESLGIDLVVRPAQQLADAIVRIVAVPGALEVQAFAGGKVRLLQHAVEEGAPISKGPLREVGVPKGVVLVMARRGDKMFIPRGDTHLQTDDKVTAFGSAKALERFRYRYLDDPEHDGNARRATIIGGGVVGLSVARGLEKAKWSVRVIEFDLRRAEEIAPLIKGMVIHGDGSDLGLLQQEQVAEDSALIVVTSNDEKNLLISLVAKQVGIDRIITRADTHNHERLFERVGIDVVRSARGAALRSVVRGLVPGRDELLVELEHGDAQVLELQIPEDVVSTPLAKMHQPVRAIVGAILRGGDVIIPCGSDSLRSGDRILTFCTKEDEHSVRTFFTKTLAEPELEPEAEPGAEKQAGR